MRNHTFIWTLLLFLNIFTLNAQTPITVEDLYETDRFNPITMDELKWLPDGKSFSHILEDDDAIRIMQYDVKSGKQEVILDSRDIPQLQTTHIEHRFTIPNYHWSPDGRQILLPADNDLYLYDLKTRQVTRLTADDAEERDPVFSPDGKKIAYLKNWNLVILDIESEKEMRLTHQGTENLLIGRFDWVTEEEFGIRTGFFWSPDGKHLAYYQVDQTVIPTFPIVDFIPVQNEVFIQRYTKAGDPIAVIRIGVVGVQGGETAWMNIGPEIDQYIPRIEWADKNHLAIQRLNRLQNHLDLLLTDIKTGESQTLLTEDDPKGWVEIHDNLTFLDDHKYFLWTSERSGRSHLYLYNRDGSLVRQLTEGEWDVTALSGVDAKKKTVYFEATEAHIRERQFYRIQLDGTGFQRITSEPGTHAIDMAPGAKIYIDEYSNVTTPTRTTLHVNDGKLKAELISGEIKGFKNRWMPQMEFLTVPIDDGLELNAYIVKPKDFDPTKKYPVLIYTYGGPESQTVQDRWWLVRGRKWHYMMLEQGYILFCLDNRGSGFKGNDFKNIVYGNIGSAVLDEFEGVKYLRTLPYVDGDRIGIWGWSYGGFMTCHALLRGSEYFKTGVAVASVTDFRNYNCIWTERYMGRPQDNPEGYDATNAMTYVDHYRNGLLLIHGDADDNVHPASTVQMVYALQNTRKPFEFMFYPRKKHSIRGTDTQIHLFNVITKYLFEEL